MVFYFKWNENSLGEGRDENSEKDMMLLPSQKIRYETIQWPSFFSVIFTLPVFLHVQSYLLLWVFGQRNLPVECLQIYQMYSSTKKKKTKKKNEVHHWPTDAWIYFK